MELKGASLVKAQLEENLEHMLVMKGSALGSRNELCERFDQQDPTKEEAVKTSGQNISVPKSREKRDERRWRKRREDSDEDDQVLG